MDRLISSLIQVINLEKPAASQMQNNFMLNLRQQRYWHYYMVYNNVFSFVFNGRKEELANGINLSSQENRADYAGNP